MKRLAVLIAAIALIPGCGMFDESTEGEVIRNFQRWKALGLHDYDFHFRRSCFCVPEATRAVLVEVRGDTIARVSDATSGEILQPGMYDRWPTVDSLFTWTLRSFGQDYRLEVTFDRSYRFPARVVGDIPNVVDEEFTNEAWGFVER